MNRYQPGTPRLTIGIAAIALTAATLGLAVVAPAAFDSGYQDAGVLAKAPVAAPIEVAIVPAKIEVVGVRNRHIAYGTGKPRG